LPITYPILYIVQFTDERSQTVNTIHIIIIAIEGVFLTVVAGCYVWYLAQEVRWAMLRNCDYLSHNKQY
jgi:hypothetical protein